MPSIRLPLEPIMIGVRRAGLGSSTTSSARWYVPSSVTRSPAQQAADDRERLLERG